VVSWWGQHYGDKESQRNWYAGIFRVDATLKNPNTKKNKNDSKDRVKTKTPYPSAIFTRTEKMWECSLVTLTQETCLFFDKTGL
jgi:hypothetical protein